MVEIRKLPGPEPEPTPEPDARDAAMAEMQAQIQGLTVLVSNVLGARGANIAVAPTPPVPLEPVANERDRILAAWAAEPRVSIFIAPDENDQRAANEMAARGLEPEFPPRVFQVNGVQLAVPVGESTTVPESIAALHAYMLNPWKSQHKVKPVTADVIFARMG